MSKITPPRHIVWSTDQVDLSDPFQRRWYIQQVLIHGRSEDIRTLNLDQVAEWFDSFSLPQNVRSLWERFLERRGAER